MGHFGQEWGNVDGPQESPLQQCSLWGWPDAVHIKPFMVACASTEAISNLHTISSVRIFASRRKDRHDLPNMSTMFWVLIKGGYVSGRDYPTPFPLLVPHKPQTTSEGGGQGWVGKVEVREVNRFICWAELCWVRGYGTFLNSISLVVNYIWKTIIPKHSLKTL